MLRILIVDDEPLFVNGLYNFLSEESFLDLDIYKAYSGVEAFDILNRLKMDIVLTDIIMPEMTGIELFNKIHSYWPQCKVIFLTGYSDFNTVHNAIHNDVVDYVLKIEGDEAILKAIKKAAALTEKEQKDDINLLKAQQYDLQTALLQQQEFILNILQGEKFTASVMNNMSAILKLPLNVKLPVLLLLGKVDQWPDDCDTSEKTRILYEVRHIANQYISQNSSIIMGVLERSKLIWLIQPDEKGLPWERIIVYVREMLEPIQTACREILRLSISFVLGSEPVFWNKISAKYNDLKSVLSLGLSTEMLFLDGIVDRLEVGRANESNPEVQKVRNELGKMDCLKVYLENGQKQEFWQLFMKIVYSNNLNTFRRYDYILEIFFSMSLMFLSYINRYGLMQTLSEEIDVSRLTDINAHESWDEVINYFQRMGVIIFEKKLNDQVRSANEIITKVNKYINDNLGESLSLAKIADYVFLNPVYLSRLYKNITGLNLFDYINEIRLEKAKELLKTSNMKIHEIAAYVGYESAAYFNRFFKRKTDFTPQGYRDSV